MSQGFVFSIVGKGKHSRRVEFASERLSRFTSFPIYIVTAKERHDINTKFNLVEVEVPDEFNDHQTSIWIKTSLPKHLPKLDLWAYLDSDVFAFEGADKIFDQFKPPITFGLDTSDLDHFSPYQLNCGCLEEFKRLQEKLDDLLQEYSGDDSAKESIEQRTKLESKLEKSNPIKQLLRFVKFNMAKDRYWLNSEFYFDKKKRAWYDVKDQLVMVDLPVQKLEQKMGFKYNPHDKSWRDEQNTDVLDVKCGHLQSNVGSKFGIDCNGTEILWNGGVFLFNEKSSIFMDNWHSKFCQILNDPFWKTRDQGVLHATRIEQELAYHKVLTGNFNRIVNEFMDMGDALDEKPQLIHITFDFKLDDIVAILENDPIEF